MDRYESLHQEIAKLAAVEGTTPLGVATLPEPFDKVLQKLIRQGAMSVQELADALDLSPHEAQHLGQHLVAKGYLRTEEQEDEGGIVFRVYLARMRKQNIPLDL
jgi:DNA-binding MarR family transcriptional regulator